MDKTNIYNIEELRHEFLLIELNEIITILKEKGYDPGNQLLGYFETGDLTYITNYKGARDKIKKFDKRELLLAIINSYME